VVYFTIFHDWHGGTEENCKNLSK